MNKSLNKTNWQTKKLGEIGVIFNGNSINERVKKEKYLGIKDGFPFIATKDVDFKSHVIDFNNGVRIPFAEKSFKIAHKNSVLICAEGGSAGRKIAFNEKDICFGNKLFAIETKRDINSKLVYYWYLTPTFFDAFKKQMNGIIGGVSIGNFKYTKGAAIKNVVSVKILKEIRLFIPKMQKQKSIVAKLDALSAETKKLENIYNQKLADLEELKKSTLKRAFNGDL